jgi:hypothetical protein
MSAHSAQNGHYKNIAKTSVELNKVVFITLLFTTQAMKYKIVG